MYNDYFGFIDAPFSISPDPRYLFLSDQHREALAHLRYGVASNGGFILLTGEVGTGKTTVCRCLLEHLPENTEVAFILNPKLTALELLAAICDELQIDLSDKKPVIKVYLDAITARLLQLHSEGWHTVLIIDEAQNLDAEVLELVRLLTNLETNVCKLLQIILLGQPELLDTLARPELRQLDQRITARYHLRALSRRELDAYIAHRLSIAGIVAQLFPQATLNRLYRLTGGIPRLINVVCDRALLGAFVQRENRVNVEVLNKAAAEVFGDKADAFGWPTWLAPRFLLLGLVFAALLLVLIGVDSRVNVLTSVTIGDDQAHGPGLPDGGGGAVGNTAVSRAATSSSLGSSSDSDNAATGSSPAAAAETSRADSLPAPAEQASPGGAVAEESLAVAPRAAQSATGHWTDAVDPGLSQVLAYRNLFHVWGIDYDPRQNPIVCRFARTQGLDCLFQKGEVESLRRLNRPAVVKLSNPQGEEIYATLVQLSGDQAILHVADQRRVIELEELERWWSHLYTIFWRVPPDYRGPLQTGSRGQGVAWLGRQLAKLQGDFPLSDTQVFDTQMFLQVQQFQKNQGLTADGIVGPRTAISLNTATMPGTPLLVGSVTSTPAVTSSN